MINDNINKIIGNPLIIINYNIIIITYRIPNIFIKSITVITNYYKQFKKIDMYVTISLMYCR